MICDVILASGLLLSTASQLRLGNLPVGPGEICLAVWLMLVLSRQVLRPAPDLTPTLLCLLVFWTVFATSQSIGSIVGLSLELFQDVSSILHDVVAYLLLAGTSCMAAIELRADARLRLIVGLFVLMGTVCLTVQMAAAANVLPLGPLELWYYDRFKGWSENPNQFALLATALALLSLHLVGTAISRFRMMVWVVCACIAAAAGVLTKSDSFVVCMLVSCPLYVVLSGRTWLKPSVRGSSFRAAACKLGLIAIPFFLLSFSPLAPMAIQRAEGFATAMFDDNSQGETRLNLWREAVERSLDSGLIGFGPGAHLTSKSYKRAPPDKFEAHNTVLDLLTQGGVVAVMGFLWLCASTLLVTVRSQLTLLSALVCALLVFSGFHLIVRQPIFWFGIVICLLEGNRIRSRASRKIDSGLSLAGANKSNVPQADIPRLERGSHIHSIYSA